MYNKVKSVKKRPFHANQAYINDKNSSTLTAPEEVLDRWHEYGANLFEKPVNERPLSTHSPENQEPLPLLSEVEQEVGMLKCGKAPGLDGASTELIQQSGPASIQVLLKLCIQIWCGCSLPDVWKRQEIVRPVTRRGSGGSDEPPFSRTPSKNYEPPPPPPTSIFPTVYLSLYSR